MTQNTGNLRVRRMQKLLREALLDLIEERGFDALTVSEIEVWERRAWEFLMPFSPLRVKTR